MENLIIIGSGPAGHTAGIYAGRAMLAPIMFEGNMAGGVSAGGQLTTTNEVENFPGFPNGINGTELMEKMREQSLNSGVKIETKTVDKVDLSSSPFAVYVGDDVYKTKSLIISTGAIAKRLGIKGESEFWQKGISACAICDGALPIFRNKVLGVVGGGDSAIEEADHLSKYASKVYMFVRRDEFRASKVMQQRAFDNEKIEILWNTEIKEAKGENVIKSVVVYDNKNDRDYDLEIGGLFYAIGHTPNTKFLDGQIELDQDGYIITKSGTTQTSVPGVFAAGDVQDKKFRQAITSAGTGCMASMEVEKYLK
ncbi:thioredoxin-disulfide reductase [Candidatus Vampirococcus lugosii]|uniref:Thioredoxin reductase n=1 Tax=Candidatus Vampirococcus lugosii TaxID=2789015 RepID=A0ABS5QPE3_9BACT|nr:thioredoxin-disulfide reductase [Candidatus Vampirococcus lugosii]MBS8122209.1 Thioredoxin reductase [Candidatus Vampirococcus lugosii]